MHPYYVAKARAAVASVGGDPDVSAQLAQWARQARADGRMATGVIVAIDTGDIVATTHTAAHGVWLDEPVGTYGELGMTLPLLRAVHGRVAYFSAYDLAAGPAPA